MMAIRTGRTAAQGAPLAALALLCLCGAGGAKDEREPPETAATSDGAVVLSRQGRGPLCLLDRRDKKPVWREFGPEFDDGLDSIDVTPDGKHAVVSTGYLTTVLALGPKVKVLRILGHKGGTSQIALSPDGKLVAASALLTNQVALYDVATGQRGRVLMQGRDDTEERAVGLRFTPDGKSLLVGTEITKRRLMFSVQTGKLLWEVKDAAGASVFAFSPDGKSAAAGGEDSVTRLFDVATGNVLAQFRAGKRLTCDVAFSPDGKRVAALTLDGGLAVWDVAGEKLLAQARGEWQDARVRFDVGGKPQLLRGRLSRRFDPDTGKFGEPEGADLPIIRRSGAERAKYENDPSLTAVSGDGSVVLSWREPGGLLGLLDGRDRKPAWRDIPTEMKLPHAIDVTPDGKHAVLTDLFVVSVFALGPKSEVLRVMKPNDGASQVAISPDGKVVALSTLQTKQVVLSDVATGKTTRTLFQGRDSKKEFPIALCFSPDGSSLLVGTLMTDRRMLFSVATGKLLWEAKDAAGAFVFAFSPDGKSAAAGDLDGGVRLFDPATGKASAEFRAGKNETIDVAFSPDGKRLAALVKGGGLAVWDVAARKVVAEAHCQGWHGRVRFAEGGKLRLLRGRFSRTFDPKTGQIGDPEEF